MAATTLLESDGTGRLQGAASVCICRGSRRQNVALCSGKKVVCEADGTNWWQSRSRSLSQKEGVDEGRERGHGEPRPAGGKERVWVQVIAPESAGPKESW